MDGDFLMHSDFIITQEYSYSHKAIDVVGSGYSVDDVVAVSDGIVEIAVSTVTTNSIGSRGTASYGNFVKIRHEDGTKSLYAHLKSGSVSVKAGDYVTKGSKIGTMGDTGNASGVHLHFEIRNSDETRVNPIEYLASKKQEETVIEANAPNEDVTDVSLENDSLDSDSEDVGSDEASLDTDSSLDNDSSEFVVSNSDDEVYYLDNHEYKAGSIVDGLKGIGEDGSYDYREMLALANGISDYHGSYEQNVYLLSLLKSGKLKSV